MAGTDNNSRIQTLEDKLHNIGSRLDVHDVELKAVAGLVEKGDDLTSSHHDQITIIGQRMVVPLLDQASHRLQLHIVDI